MWIWLVAGMVLFFLLIFACSLSGEIDSRGGEPYDEDDELVEGLLLIDLLDEEDEEE